MGEGGRGLERGYLVGGGATLTPLAFEAELRGLLSSSDEKLLVLWSLCSGSVGLPSEPQPTQRRTRPNTRKKQDRPEE
jgi:hypothetical protein